MRTQLEVDPGIGLRGLEGVRKLVDEYRWAIDIEICIFPQEGLLNNPGTDELMVEALKQRRQRGRRRALHGFEPARADRPHLRDRARVRHRYRHASRLRADPDDLDLLYVCEQTEKFRYGGRVAIGHVTKLSGAPPELFDRCARRMADAGVALTVLPSTDLYLMGRHMDHSVMRGVTASHKLLHHGVNCSLSTNNVLNPFTPFGDCSLVRMANLYANICQVGAKGDIRECFHMISSRSARLMNLKNYGLAPGCAADLVVLDAASAEEAVAELAPVLYVFKRGRKTVSRARAQLHRPH